MASVISSNKKPIATTTSTALTRVSSHSSAAAKSVATTGKVARHESRHDIVTIVVSTLDRKQLKKDCISTSRNKWLSRGPNEVHLTDVESLQATIDSLRLSSKRQTLNILASGEVEAIRFDVPSHFHTLKILRCVPDRDRGMLLVDGASTFHNTPLERWQAHHHKRHTLIVGHERGVRIRISGLAGLPSWSRHREGYTDEERDDIRRKFEAMALAQASRTVANATGGGGEGAELSGAAKGDSAAAAATESDKHLETVNDLIAGVLKILTGSDRFGLSFQRADGGLCAKFAFGLHALEIGAAGLKLSTVSTAAGPAVILGVAAGAAIYYIPWGEVFAWFKTALGWLWDKIKFLWEKFTVWIQRYFANRSEEGEGGGKGGAPAKKSKAVESRKKVK